MTAKAVVTCWITSSTTVLTFGEIHKLMIDLPADSAFLQANLHPDNLDAAIRSVES